MKYLVRLSTISHSVQTANIIAGPLCTQLFPWHHSGCQLKRTWPIGETKALLDRRWLTLLNEVPRLRGGLFKDVLQGRTTDSKVEPLLKTTIDQKLPPLKTLDLDGEYESIERYGYRSFDRQWVIADNRLADRPRPALWRVWGPAQTFLTTLTSAKLGDGLVLSVTPYIPDVDNFRGSGARNVIPLYGDFEGLNPNITDGLQEAIEKSYRLPCYRRRFIRICLFIRSNVCVWGAIC